ncbi:MAG: murein hydrolase activator EnvC family protein [Flavisolibacter sp.]
MKKLLTIFICFLSVNLAFTQTTSDKAQLERERQEIQKEIAEIQANYNKVRGLKKESLAKLSILQRKLQLQDKLIGNINKEIRTINDDIYLSSKEINHKQAELDTLKAQYARNVVFAYKSNSSYEFINFIFSATNFNEAMKRISYLKSYRAYRSQQVTNILEAKKALEDRKQQLMGKQTQKKSALQNQQHQLNELAVQKKEKDAVVTKLKSQEKSLSKEIASKKKRDNQLKNQIAAVLRRLADEEFKKKAATTTTTTNPTTGKTTTTTTKPKTTKAPDYKNMNEGQKTLAVSFEKNRGSLPWPVDNGVVTIPYGTSKVEGLTMDNPGITISTPSAGVSVKSVFDGEVSAVSNLGDGMMVMVRHGKYFTVYSNLSTANVSKGSAVKTGQVIGRAASADDGTGGQVDFILMVESKNVNPTPWLRR